MAISTKSAKLAPVIILAILFLAVGITLIMIPSSPSASSHEVASYGASSDRVVIEKGAHRLSLMSHGKLLKAYIVALGTRGPKEREGDGRTPEGLYVIDGRNASSAFHHALHISYPNASDRARAAAGGFSPGGNIMIHGIRNRLGWIGHFHRTFDWTNGCIAVTDEEIDEIWNLVPNGTAVEIRP